MTQKKTLLLLFFVIVAFAGCSKDDDSALSEVDYIDTSKEVMKTSLNTTITREIDGKPLNIVEWIPFSSYEGLRPVFRIPSAIITNEGSILVACENRDIFNDKGKIDILIARKSVSDFEGGNKQV